MLVKSFVTRGHVPFAAQLLDMYPWLSTEDADRIVNECALKMEGSTSQYEAQMQVASHYWNEAQRLKPR